jgi:multiple sugar transport system permease protein
VIAVAFSWVILFDPFSGSVNALLIQMGVTSDQRSISSGSGRSR